MPREKPFLVLGLGNPLLSDDTIGLNAVQAAEQKFGQHMPQVAFICLTACTFDLAHEINGFQKMVVVDSIHTGQAEPGFCHEFAWETLQAFEQKCPVNLHCMNLPSIIANASHLGFSMPQEIVILGIEGREFQTFSESASLSLQQELPMILNTLERILIKWSNPSFSLNMC